MNSLTDDVKHESERGEILKILVDWGLDWIPVYELRSQIQSRTGRRLTDAQMQFHLSYLEQGGYAERKRLRAGRAEVELTVIRGTPKTADLVAQLSSPDPGIAL